MTSTTSLLSSSSSSVTAAIRNFESITATNRAFNQELMEFETSRSSIFNSSRGSLLSGSRNNFHNSRGSLKFSDSKSILQFESSKSSIDYEHESTTKEHTEHAADDNLESYIRATKDESCNHDGSLRFSDLDDATDVTWEESCSDIYSLSTASTHGPSSKHHHPQQHWKPSRPTFTPLEIDEDTESSFPENVEEWNFVKILGEGQFGQVWQVDRKDDEKNFRSYALKCLSKYELVLNGQVELITQEKNIMRKINHPSIIRLRAAWQDENLIYLLQDFLQGGELYTVMLDKNAKYNSDEEIPPRRILPERDAQFYAACIADALVYLHSQCIVFRDLKPENVLLDHLGYPVLIDLGLAKILDADDHKTYTMVGTPRYLSPEQIDGCGHSFGVDHWALAIVTYEMLTGTHPFDEWDGTDEMALYSSITDTPYRPFLETSKVSAKAKNWIDRLFEKNPTQRLGFSSKGSEILSHPWLSTMDPNALRHRRYEAPWVPQLASLADSSHFDDWDHLEPVVRPEYPKLTNREAALFDIFDK